MIASSSEIRAFKSVSSLMIASRESGAAGGAGAVPVTLEVEAGVDATGFVAAPDDATESDPCPDLAGGTAKAV
jgi:hypothetical protein